jgi:tRNA threonylcarbamoyladenosine biosynthesis protein TsaE
MTWSRIVADLDEARAALADPGDALDLRVAAALDPLWEALGAHEVVPGELAVPVPQRLPDLAATQALGRRVAQGLRAGDLVVLSGPLGAGKTSFAQGVGAGLGVRGAVTSPTFVLARVHRGPLPMVHVDAYRLREAGADVDLEDLDLDASLEDGVTVVEWGEGVVERLSPSRLLVALSRGDGMSNGTSPDRDESRMVCLRAQGPRWVVVHSP